MHNLLKQPKEKPVSKVEGMLISKSSSAAETTGVNPGKSRRLGKKTNSANLQGGENLIKEI